MNVSPTAVEPKAPNARSKFHNAFHEQAQIGAKLRRAKALDLFLGGRPLTEIAKILGVDYSTAWRYLQRELDTSRAANVEKAEAIREQLLHRLYRIVNEALAAFERSCRRGNTKTRVTEREGSDGKFREQVNEFERG